MFEIKSFTSAMAQIAEEKGIPQEKVIEVIEQALAAAYKKDYGKKGQIVKAKLFPKTGDTKFWQVKLVVSDEMIYSEEELEKLKEEGEPAFAEATADKEKIRFNPEKHIMLEEAKKIEPKIKAGDEIEMVLEAQEDYGRIAAQTAKQVILQKIKEAERESILQEYESKKGEIISGLVQRIEPGAVFFDIGKTVGILPREEQISGEFYRPNQRFRLYILNVENTPKGPQIILSRAYPKMVSKLFELEVPEISADQVSIKSIAREAGSRSKIAVLSDSEGMDPIGAMVGQRGTRVAAVINELGGEKIDIIEYSDEPEKYIANSLSPAKVLEVKIMPKNKALVLVPEDQLSLAIGKEGQNVRLAAKLTGWKIDVRSPETEKEVKIEDKKGQTKNKTKSKKEKI
ncbi:transcription termination/antitermination protein NusA [Candidatus Parcubacteria bacterium]|nr:transcription termination/antitermination protein NusA [Candidatus Parcubacteria bacterium]